MASTRKLIDDWIEAGLPRDQATKMALALDDHLESKVVDKPMLDIRMAELDKSLSARMAELERNLTARMGELERALAALETRLLVRVIGLVVVQLGLFWAITRL